MNSLDETTRRLHIAVEHGDIELANSLIKHGAAVNDTNSFGDSPLHIAVKYSNTELALSLIKHGASLDQEDTFGNPPLHNAVEYGDTELALALIKHGASLKQQNTFGDSPLHIAVKVGSTDISELAVSLIKHGASLDQEDIFGNPLLHKAVKHGNTKLAISLIKHGASLKQQNGFGYPPLHIAVEDGNTEIALSLIKHGACVNQENIFLHLPLSIAMEHGHTELVRSLLKHGASVNQSTNRIPPIRYYGMEVNEDGMHFTDANFTELIPGSNIDILKTICQIFEKKRPSDSGIEHNLEVVSNMLHKLIQHLILTEPLSITIRGKIQFQMKLNQRVIISSASLKTVYLCSVLLILLECSASFNAVLPLLASLHPATTVEDTLVACAIDDLWNAYKQKTGIRKLQALCIQKTRQSMCSFTDNSFQSLPVPPRLQKMLMLQDIADVLCEGYQMWPKYMCIDELM